MAEGFVYNHTLILLELLALGLPYEAILEMEELEINRFLGAHFAKQERENEMREAQARQRL